MHKFNKLLILIFLASAALFSYKISLGFFSDTEETLDNSLTAAASYPTTIPSPSQSASPSATPTSSP